MQFLATENVKVWMFATTLQIDDHSSYYSIINFCHTTQNFKSPISCLKTDHNITPFSFFFFNRLFRTSQVTGPLDVTGMTGHNHTKNGHIGLKFDNLHTFSENNVMVNKTHF